VRYLPQLKKNFISVGAMESKGLKVTMKNGITVTGVLTASLNSDEDTTRLWHMRLGHTCEKSLKALTKQGLLKVLRSAR